MLTAVQQRFLARPSVLANVTWRLLLDDEESTSLRKGISGHYYGDFAYEVWSDGIGWTDTRDDRPQRRDRGDGWLMSGKASAWPNHITWTQARRHRDAQSSAARARLRAAVDALTAEHSRHWQANDAIHDGWYANATPDQRARLDAEFDRHMAALEPLEDELRTAVLAMLPDAGDEPADLIEWAERLA